MRINTRLDRIELTKQEERTLESAKALLLKLAKHGDGDLAEAAETAAEAVGDTINHLLKPEPAGA